MDAFSEKEPEFLVASQKLMTKLFSGNIHAGMAAQKPFDPDPDQCSVPLFPADSIAFRAACRRIPQGGAEL